MNKSPTCPYFPQRILKMPLLLLVPRHCQVAQGERHDRKLGDWAGPAMANPGLQCLSDVGLHLADCTFAGILAAEFVPNLRLGTRIGLGLATDVHRRVTGTGSHEMGES